MKATELRYFPVCLIVLDWLPAGLGYKEISRCEKSWRLSIESVDSRHCTLQQVSIVRCAPTQLLNQIGPFRKSFLQGSYELILCVKRVISNTPHQTLDTVEVNCHSYFILDN